MVETPEATETDENSDESDVEDSDPPPKHPLIDCAKALLTLRTYYHYEGSECDNFLDGIEANICIRAASRVTQSRVSDYFASVQ